MRLSHPQIIRLGSRALTATLAALLATFALAATGALAAHVATANPPKPKSGPWQVTANSSSGVSGGFTVTNKHYVTGFHGTIQPGGQAACGTGTITVAGKQKIVFSSGIGWIVGKPIGLGRTAANVSVTEGGQTVKGLLSISFVSPAAAKITGSGTTGFVSYDAGACELTFAATHG